MVVCGDTGGGQGGQRWWPVGIEMVVCKDRGGGIKGLKWWSVLHNEHKWPVNMMI